MHAKLTLEHRKNPKELTRRKIKHILSIKNNNNMDFKQFCNRGIHNRN